MEIKELDLGGMKSTFFGKLIDPVDIGPVDAAVSAGLGYIVSK